MFPQDIPQDEDLLKNEIKILIKISLPELTLNANRNYDADAEKLYEIVTELKFHETQPEYLDRIKQFKFLIANSLRAVQDNNFDEIKKSHAEICEHLLSPKYQIPNTWTAYLYNTYYYNEYLKYMDNKNFIEKLITDINLSDDKKNFITFIVSIMKNVFSRDNLKIISAAGEIKLDPKLPIRAMCLSGNAQTQGGNNKIYLLSHVDNVNLQTIINCSIFPKEAEQVLKQFKEKNCPYLIPTYYEITIDSEDEFDSSAEKTVIRLMNVAKNLQDITKKTKEDISTQKIIFTIESAIKMIECIDWLRKNDIFFPDMKLSNFFMDEENKIILPDIKTMVPYGFKKYDALNNTLISSRIFESTPIFLPPEIRENNPDFYNVNSYESYIIGLNLFIMLTGDNPGAKLGKRDIWNGVKLVFNFDNYPIFTLSSGSELKKIIEDLVSDEPRLQLEKAKTLLKELQLNITEKQRIRISPSSLGYSSFTLLAKKPLNPDASKQTLTTPTIHPEDEEQIKKFLLTLKEFITLLLQEVGDDHPQTFDYLKQQFNVIDHAFKTTFTNWPKVLNDVITFGAMGAKQMNGNSSSLKNYFDLFLTHKNLSEIESYIHTYHFSPKLKK